MGTRLCIPGLVRAWQAYEYAYVTCMHACAHTIFTYVKKINAHIKQRKTCSKRINKDRDKQVTVNL